jgi:hypothetical protein
VTAPNHTHHFSGQVVVSHPRQDALRGLIRGAHAFPGQNGGLLLDDRVPLRFVGIVEQRALNEARGDGIDAHRASSSAMASTVDSMSVCIMPEAELRWKMQGIMTFAIRITRLEGKLKLSQNRSPADQQRVAATLQQCADPMSRDVGAVMQQRQEARRT